MSVETNKKVVQRILDGIATGKTDDFEELCSEEFVNHAAPGRPPGVQGLKDVAGFSHRAQPDQRWSELHIVAEGDLVVAYGVREATWQATEFRGVPTPQGVRVAVELAHMFRVTDGKVTEHWAVRDDLGMLQQLDALPKPGD